MPRGKWTNHKGRNRRFTNFEELEQERIQDQKDKTWKARNRDLPPTDDDDDEEGDGSESEGSESDDSDGDETSKAKGVESLIQIENPNRVQKKTKKLSALSENDNVQLSRREREELEKQKAALHYQKLHAEGKTEEARADLARLAIIRQQREEAARKREQEKKEKELAKQTKTADSLKAIAKR